MKSLYIFPHPDDESFGPAPVMYRQVQAGEEVHLLTLTRGGATKQRFKYGLTIEEMGRVRLKEMKAVERVLNLTSMEVLDYEDGGLQRMNPLDLEKLVLSYIDKIQPNLIVTYPIHGVSGHHDHLAIHGVVKRLFCALRQKPDYQFLQRLAFFTLPVPKDSKEKGGTAHVNRTKWKDIDCVVQLTEEEREVLKEALYCYETFMDIIKETGVIEEIGDRVHFEFFGEDHQPVLSNLTDGLKNRR